MPAYNKRLRINSIGSVPIYSALLAVISLMLLLISLSLPSLMVQIVMWVGIGFLVIIALAIYLMKQMLLTFAVRIEGVLDAQRRSVYVPIKD